jgi:hypothetical protein
LCCSTYPHLILVHPPAPFLYIPHTVIAFPLRTRPPSLHKLLFLLLPPLCLVLPWSFRSQTYNNYHPPASQPYGFTWVTLNLTIGLILLASHLFAHRRTRRHTPATTLEPNPLSSYIFSIIITFFLPVSQWSIECTDLFGGD